MRARWLLLGAIAIVALGAVLVVVLGGGSGSAGESYEQVAGLDDFFSPQIIRVPAGATVEWQNHGRNAHTVTADDGSYDSGILQRNDEFSHTYATPGIYRFSCVLHGKKGGIGMTGVVVVGDVALTSPSGGVGVGPGREPVPTAPGKTIRVPGDRPSIQAAVDAAGPGDLVLVSPGVYHEAVLVLTPYVTIRGTDRNAVILDGDFTKTNGIHVVEADGVAIENITARHFALNGFYWSGVQGYRGSYLTAYANGDYGVYAFDSTWGRFEHSYASGSPDSAFYIGQCQPCHAVIDDVIASGSALGYSGTNAGGDLWILNSEWVGNGSGIAPNTLDSEGLAPQRSVTIAGNWVHGSGRTQIPTKRLEYPAEGVGIIVAGGRDDTVQGNLVADSRIYGIALMPNVDDNFWATRGNEVRANDVRGSGQADLVLGAPSVRDDCFEANSHSTSLPPAIETFAGCSVRAGAGGDLGPSLALLARFTSALGGNYETADWKASPDAPAQPSMADADTAPVVLAIPESAVPGPHVIRTLDETRAVAAGASTTTGKEPLVMSIPLGPLGSTLLGLYAYVLPLALYATWLALAVWDLVRRDITDRRRIGWMAVVLAVPVIGPIAYFGLGGSEISRAVRLFLVVGGIAIYLVVAALAAVIPAL